MRVHVNVLQSSFPECQDMLCAYIKECANHMTAGDFRTEGGMTPDLHKTAQGWECSKHPRNEGVGAVHAGGPPPIDRSHDIVDNLRILMYGDCDAHTQVKLLARLLGEHDGVASGVLDNKLLRLVKGEGT